MLFCVIVLKIDTVLPTKVETVKTTDNSKVILSILPEILYFNGLFNNLARKKQFTVAGNHEYRETDNKQLKLSKASYWF